MDEGWKGGPEQKEEQLLRGAVSYNLFVIKFGITGRQEVVVDNVGQAAGVGHGGSCISHGTGYRSIPRGR